MKCLLITQKNYDRGYLTGATIEDLPDGQHPEDRKGRYATFYRASGQLSVGDVSNGTNMVAIPLDSSHPFRYRVERNLMGERVILPPAF